MIGFDEATPWPYDVHMVQMLIQLDEKLAATLETIAPGKSRKRSEFIRLAIIKAIMEVQDEATREAYERQPDNEPIYFNPGVWSEARPRQRPRKKK